jgi:hypothetical protein
MILKFKCYNIDWDTDGEDPKSLGIPATKTVEVDADPELLDDMDYMDELVGDALTDATGWCHNGFCYKKA